MRKENILLIAGACILLLGIIIGIIIKECPNGGFNSYDGELGGSQNYNLLRNVSKNASTTVLTTSTTILSENRARSYAAITNDCSSPVYISLSDSASLYEGIRLNADGGSYEILPENLYTGVVAGISETDCVVTYVEN